MPEGNWIKIRRMDITQTSNLEAALARLKGGDPRAYVVLFPTFEGGSGSTALIWNPHCLYNPVLLEYAGSREVRIVDGYNLVIIGTAAGQIYEDLVAKVT
jgi:hypothetical protein